MTMSAKCEDNQVFRCILPEDEDVCLPSVLEAVWKQSLQDAPADLDLIYIGNRDSCDGIHVKSPSELLVEFYRDLGQGTSRFKTLLSAESQMVVVQLCLAEYSKQKYGVYDTDASEVLQITREINELGVSQSSSNFSEENNTENTTGVSDSLSMLESVRRIYEIFLSNSNMVDLSGVYQYVKSVFDKDEDASKLFRAKRKFVILRWPSDSFERKVLRLLCGQATVTEIQVQMALEPSTKENGEYECFTEEKGWEMLEELEDGDRKCSRSPPVSSTENLVHRVFVSFLSLLVNSRDELALARCLSYSPSGLGHNGFTALKNMAKTKNMSMYQTAVSYITRIRLGGRSYAPHSETSSLSDHVKNLSEFVTNVQKLQMIIEEIPDTRQSITTVLTSIKKILCKCRESVFQPTTVEKVCGKLKSKFDVLVEAFSEVHKGSPPKAISQGGSVLGRKTLRVIQKFLDGEAVQPVSHNAVTVLGNCVLTQARTPTRMPSLLDQFRSPEIVNPESPENRSLRDRISLGKEEAKKPELVGYKSDMAWAEQLGKTPTLRDQNLNVDQHAPSRASNQPVKLWAVTPPAKNNAERIIAHYTELESQSADVSIRPTGMNTKASNKMDHTPRRPKGRGRKTTEAALDKENLGSQTADAVSKLKGAETKKRVKRALIEDSGSSQLSKKAKKATTGGQKKKTAPLLKGQKTLNQFFRL